MKKVGFICFIILALITIPLLVSAAWDLGAVSTRIIDLIQQIFGPFFVAFLGGSSEFLFERALLFFVIFSLVFIILGKINLFDDRAGAKVIVTLAVSILSSRFLPEAAITENIKTILLSYNVLGIVLTAGLPLIIFFFFVHSFESSALRKMLWIFFLVIYMGMWLSNYEAWGELSWIYFITGIAALIFFLSDGTIRRILVNAQMKQLGFNRRQDFEREIQRQIMKADEDLTKTIITPRQHYYIKRRLQKQLKAIRKN
ncbi:MAG: hypothetical protein NT076_00200 [Candidatus Pacearchaeota archaeon]|nr:hypothetical protein [Candidatus Pacearchaeota archaeon]